MSTKRPGGAVEAGLARFEELIGSDHHLAVSVTTNADGTPQVAVVNVGIIDHPATGAAHVAFVSRRGPKLSNLRRRPTVTLLARAGWEWIAVSGPVTLIGPDDPHPGVDGERLRRLLRDIFHAAGGKHDDLAVYDEVMATERRHAVLVDPQRFVSNPPGSEHREPGR